MSTILLLLLYVVKREYVTFSYQDYLDQDPSLDLAQDIDPDPDQDLELDLGLDPDLDQDQDPYPDQDLSL